MTRQWLLNYKRAVKNLESLLIKSDSLRGKKKRTHEIFMLGEVEKRKNILLDLLDEI